LYTDSLLSGATTAFLEMDQMKMGSLSYVIAPAVAAASVTRVTAQADSTRVSGRHAHRSHYGCRNDCPGLMGVDHASGVEAGRIEELVRV
jgi:hypothetical protein